MFIKGLYVTLILAFVGGKLIRNDDICGEFDGRRMYLEQGEYGVLEARNRTDDDYRVRNPATHKQCSLELITCPSCVITIKFTFLNISRHCGKNSVQDSCGCDYVWIYEPPFEEVSGEQFCGHFVNSNSTSLMYKSQTRSTAVTFLFSSFHEHAFTLSYSSERNRHLLDGYPKYSHMNNVSQFISSPFFPYNYPRDLNTEYVINCKTSENCRVRLIFTDFQLSSNSLIEFFDWNGQRMHVATGGYFRPPLLISSGPTMVIRFYANGGTNLGFKASYMFLVGERDNSTLKPDTDCGGYVDNLGGGITMMNMFKHNTKSFDCFWIIRPPESYMHLKKQLYLKVITFSDFAGSTELIIRQGVTSNEPIIEVLRHPVSHYVMSRQKEHVVSISQGFYVSLKGLFRPESRVAIIYSAFNYKDCYSGSDFLCRNLRCIPVYLICDGFDHCGDNSDETTSCLKEPQDRLRWSHAPNFYFPKTDRYSYLRTATIIFVFCSMGLMTLIFALVMLLYRINYRNRNQRQLQTHLQTINDILEEGNTGVTEEEIIIPDDEPPLYEAPPDYEDVLKMGKNGKRGNRKSSKRLDLKLKRTCLKCETVMSNELPALAEVREINEVSASTSRSSQTTPLPPPTPVQVQVPRSPPPAYTSVPTIHITFNNEISNMQHHALEHVCNIGIDEVPVNIIMDASLNHTVSASMPAEGTSRSLVTNMIKFFSLQDMKTNCVDQRRFSLDIELKTNSITSLRSECFENNLENVRRWLSDTQLLPNVGQQNVASNQTEEGRVRNLRLRRSASIENLASIVVA